MDLPVQLLNMAGGSEVGAPQAKKNLEFDGRGVEAPPRGTVTSEP